jgi:hypothetical protein
MILLFDVDGVLIEHRAYRASIQHTVIYFAERLGLATPPPTREDIDVFESESITVEWDTCAIIATALLLERLRAEADSANGHTILAALPGDLWKLLDDLPARPHSLAVNVDYGGLARRTGERSRATGQLPGRAALGEAQEEVRADPSLPTGPVTALLEQLLGDVYAIQRAPGKQVFQNYALGDQHYADYYELAPRVRAESLLEKLDESLLDPGWRDEILRRRAGGEWHAALYTARPSLAPAEAGARVPGFTPEAEIAREMAGLGDVPVMGFGKLDWWAQRIGRAGAQLVKPSPMHAMAAMAAACTGLELESIKAAMAVTRGDHLRYPLTACAGQHVHVFEDSPSSLGAVRGAVALLNRQGLGLRLSCHGIAAAGSPKGKTLAQAADGVYADVNAALEACASAPGRRRKKTRQP